MPGYSVTKRRGKTKIKLEEKRKAVMHKIADSYSGELDLKMSLIQELIPVGLNEIAKELQAEVTRLAGSKYARGGDNARWGGQNGSVYLRDQKFPIKVPRVRDTAANQEVLLKTYQRLQEPFADDANTVLNPNCALDNGEYG